MFIPTVTRVTSFCASATIRLPSSAGSSLTSHSDPSFALSSAKVRNPFGVHRIFHLPFHLYQPHKLRNLIMMSLATSVAKTMAKSRPASSRIWTTTRAVHTEAKLEELGIVLPPPPEPKANYNVVCHASGNMVYISGHLPFENDGHLITGRIGEEGRDVDYGYHASRVIGMNLLSTLKEQLGDLDRVEQVVKVFGIVNSTSDFTEQHLVMNGCSDLIMDVFGKERGYHARSAIGTNTLPLNVSVEVEAIIQLKSEN